VAENETAKRKILNVKLQIFLISESPKPNEFARIESLVS
jgi:hypothetical protein